MVGASNENRFLDCRGLQCPIPIVRVSKEIRDMKPGELLVVEATDRAFRADIEAWSRQTKHELVEFQDGEVKRASIRKSGETA